MDKTLNRRLLNSVQSDQKRLIKVHVHKIVISLFFTHVNVRSVLKMSAFGTTCVF